MTQRPRPSHSLAPWLVAALATAGCNFGIDPNLVKGDGSGDGGVPCQGPQCDPEQDGSMQACTGLSCNDTDGGTDASNPPLCDNPPCDEQCDGCEEQPVPCTGDDGTCLADEYCSKRTGFCEERCSEELGCATGFVTNAYSLISDARQVYWSTWPSLDELGNEIDKGAVWAWDLKGAPTRLVERAMTPLMAVDGVLYLIDGEDWVIVRMPVDGSKPPEAMVGATSVWSTTDFVWWSIGVAPGQAELWRKSRDIESKAVPELVGGATHGGWVAGTATHVISATWIPEDDMYVLKSSLIGDLDGEASVVRIYDYTQLFSDDRHVYVYEEDGALFRSDPADLGQSIILSPMTRDIQAHLKGSWLYWALQDEDKYLTIGRTASGLQTPPATFVKVPVTRESGQATALGNQLVYATNGEHRLFVKEMPPHPCSVALPCPEGLSCGDDALCH